VLVKCFCKFVFFVVSIVGVFLLLPVQLKELDLDLVDESMPLVAHLTITLDLAHVFLQQVFHRRNQKKFFLH